jgi:hypothetical protein
VGFMPDFIENVYEEFKDYILPLKLQANRILPLDEGFTIGPKEPNHTPDDAEQAKYRKLGDPLGSTWNQLYGSVGQAVRRLAVRCGSYSGHIIKLLWLVIKRCRGS